MAISSFNKRAKTVRIKITAQEMRNFSPPAGINIQQYAPEQNFRQIITHPNGLKSVIWTQSSGKGEMNINLQASGVHFIPTERRFEEDIEKALEGLNIITEQVTEKEEPAHFNHRNKGMNLEFMEHQTFVEIPTLDSIDAVRSKMTNIRPQFFTQTEYKLIEGMMTKKPQIFGSPSNAQAIPRFLKERNNGERNPITGEKSFEAQVGTY